MGSLEFTEP